MGLADFLFEGQPPPSVTTYGQTVEQLPQWLSDYTQGVIGKANAIASQPYQAYTGPRIAGFNNDQTKAFDITRQNVGSWQAPMQQAQTLAGQSSGQGALTQASPWLNMAGDFYSRSTDPQFSSVNAAAPHMQTASQSFPQAAQTYMDPYVENVINRGTQLAMRNFNENVMPGINDQFIRQGQYGSSAHLREANKGTRDLTEGINSANMGALSQAYQSAGQMFGQDASRAAGLAGLAGQLNESDRQALTQAGSGLSALGATRGNLELGAAGQNMNAARTMADIGTASQTAGLKDAAALSAAGAEQQGQGQANLDLAYQDFQNQTQYPRDQLDWLSSIIRGQQMPRATTTTNVAPLAGSKYGASPLSQLGSLIDIYNGIRGSARGGYIEDGYAEGGKVGTVSRALASLIERAKGHADMGSPAHARKEVDNAFEMGYLSDEDYETALGHVEDHIKTRGRPKRKGFYSGGPVHMGFGGALRRAILAAQAEAAPEGGDASTLEAPVMRHMTHVAPRGRGFGSGMRGVVARAMLQAQRNFDDGGERDNGELGELPTTGMAPKHRALTYKNRGGLSCLTE